MPPPYVVQKFSNVSAQLIREVPCRHVAVRAWERMERVSIRTDSSRVFVATLKNNYGCSTDTLPVVFIHLRFKFLGFGAEFIDNADNMRHAVREEQRSCKHSEDAEHALSFIASRDVSISYCR